VAVAFAPLLAQLAAVLGERIEVRGEPGFPLARFEIESR
jgi:hypothetical protein